MEKLTNLIAPAFYKLHKQIKKHKYTYYWLKGGRGSGKSSFIAIEIILNIMKDAENGDYGDAVIFRRVKDVLRSSVFEQIKWAIYKLGVQEYWDIPESKLQITYKPTGQAIYFKGADNAKKSKSIKTKYYIKYIWYEEVDEFENYDKIRTINQSLMRGGSNYFVFFSFNPPESKRNWVNLHILDEREDQIVHHSTYLTVPKEWLGEPFIGEAEYLKEHNYKKYEHDYLGVVTGTGLEVFTNVTVRKITQEEIDNFEYIYLGMDFGFAADPTAFVKCSYNRNHRTVYIFDEIYKVHMSNQQIHDEVLEKNKMNDKVSCDSAEPRTINELNQLGLNCFGVKKGPDSVRKGLKWLSEDVVEIVIDGIKCPNVKREFLGYELEKDKDGNPKGYPDKDNHSIDAVRYALKSCIDGSVYSFN